MDFYNSCLQGVKKLREMTPIDTGNLRYNGVQYESPDADTFVIYVDYYDAKTHNGIAWYMPYTNEPWINRKGKNPNEGWWQKAVQAAAERIADELGGELKVL